MHEIETYQLSGYRKKDYCKQEYIILTFEEMVLPLVSDNPKRWLGATITKLNDGDKYYYFLKSDAVYALFGM